MIPTLRPRIVGLVLALASALVGGLEPSAEEGAWRSLFDGQTFAGWRVFGQAGPPTQGWSIEDGILKKRAGERGGDLVTEETFEEFELSWEWKLPPGANSGVKYFVLESRGRTIGHEYQMIDDQRIPLGKQSTASFYDVLPPRSDRQPPRIGEWNVSRIVVRGAHVEHWLNEEKVLDYELGSPEVLEAVGRSKFKSVAGFGTRQRGHIMLTDHTDEAWFRNIRIRAAQVDSGSSAVSADR